MLDQDKRAGREVLIGYSMATGTGAVLNMPRKRSFDCLDAGQRGEFGTLRITLKIEVMVRKIIPAKDGIKSQCDLINIQFDVSDIICLIL